MGTQHPQLVVPRERETERETEREREREREKAGRCGSAGGGVGRVSVPPVRSGLV